MENPSNIQLYMLYWHQPIYLALFRLISATDFSSWDVIVSFWSIASFELKLMHKTSVAKHLHFLCFFSRLKGWQFIFSKGGIKFWVKEGIKIAVASFSMQIICFPLAHLSLSPSLLLCDCYLLTHAHHLPFLFVSGTVLPSPLSPTSCISLSLCPSIIIISSYNVVHNIVQ